MKTRLTTEESTLLSKRDWINIFNTIPDIITIHDRDFNIITANKTAERSLGLPSLESSETKCFKYYHGTDSPLKKCPSCQCLKTGKPATFEVFEPHLDKFLEIRAIPRFDSNNQLEGLIHIVRDITKRKEAGEKLRIQADNLAEANIALKVLLKQRENDKVELEEKVLSNVKTLIVPYVEKLKGTLPHSSNKNYVSIVETNINKIVSPFSHKLSSNHFGLSHREIQVANLIKEGYQSKEIAEMLQISFETVNDYRRIIRKKLGIKNKKVNLKVNLLSLSD